MSIITETAKKAIDTAVTQAHTNRIKHAELLNYWQEKAEQLHSTQRCDHQWVEHNTYIQCTQCEWQQYFLQHNPETIDDVAETETTETPTRYPTVKHELASTG